MSLDRRQSAYPDEAPAREAIARELQWVEEHVLAGKEGGVLKVEDVQQFVVTAPGPGSEGAQAKMQRESLLFVMALARETLTRESFPAPYFPNPQTAAFCTLLQIENKIDQIVPAGAPP